MNDTIKNNGICVKDVRDACKEHIIKKYKQIILESKDLCSNKDVSMTTKEIKILDKVLYVLWNIGYLDGLEEIDNTQKELNEQRKLFEEAQDKQRRILDERIKQSAWIEEYNKNLKSLVCTQKQLILEYQRQLGIETITEI